MNFLAHLYLSGSSAPLQVGNFIGDFIKGEPPLEFPEEIRKGIFLHREIDTFTDQHPVVLQSKVRLRERYRHYAPVIVDIYYDHFLARHWDSFHQQELKSYTLSAYKNIQSFDPILPEKVKFMLTYMIRDNWLFHYQYLEGIERVMQGMSRRTSFESGMENAVYDLEKDYEKYEEEFLQFFPDLKSHVYTYLEKKLPDH